MDWRSMEEKIYRRMKDLPESERPYEKCQIYGVDSLTDAELLAVIIRTGTRNCQSVELARQVLSISGQYEGILSIHHVTMENLLELKGIGQVKATQILCVAELAKRLAKASVDTRQQFHSPKEVADAYMESMRHLEKEEVRLLLFDGKHRLIKESTISVGTVNASICNSREVFIEALNAKAVHMILLHNHPSGDPTPSGEDLRITKKLQEGADMIGISLSDHIIIGEHCYTSFKEKGLI